MPVRRRALMKVTEGSDTDSRRYIHRYTGRHMYICRYTDR
jgi:hypothetical protein